MVADRFGISADMFTLAGIVTNDSYLSDKDNKNMQSGI